MNVNWDRLSKVLGIEGDRSMHDFDFLSAAQVELQIALDLVRRAMQSKALEDYKAEKAGSQ